MIRIHCDRIQLPEFCRGLGAYLDRKGMRTRVLSENKEGGFRVERRSKDVGDDGCCAKLPLEMKEFAMRPDREVVCAIILAVLLTNLELCRRHKHIVIRIGTQGTGIFSPLGGPHSEIISSNDSSVTLIRINVPEKSRHYTEPVLMSLDGVDTECKALTSSAPIL